MANDVSTVTSRLVTELSAGLATDYSGVLVQRGLWRPASLPPFTRYAVIVVPNTRPFDERRIAIRAIEYIIRVDLYVLVKAWDTSDDPLFGTTAGSLGLFELIEAVKDLLRLSDLSGLLDKTYDEAGGDASRQGPGGVEFQDVIAGFDSGEHAFVHRARVPFLGRIKPFCHNTV